MVKPSLTAEKTYHHGDLRRALLDAALVILQTKDVKSLSLRGVAREAGVSHTAPYRHFADKAALLAAVAEEGFVEFGQYLQKAVDAADADPIESLKAAGVAYVRYAIQHPVHFRLMFNNHALAPSCAPATSSFYTASKATFQILVDIVSAGQAEGTLTGSDPESLATGRWALVHGLAMLMLDGMLPAEEEEAISLTQSIITDSLSSILSKPAV
ncbi:MAG: TetR/AcrR family transcriptional regulator [Cyanobacteria bacterium P01_D01_bin.105]